MVSLKSLLLTAAVAVAIPLDEELFGRSVDFGSKLPHNDLAARQQGGGDKEGYGFHSGYFYSFWSDGSRGSVTYKNGNNGSYTSNWSNIGNWVGGKGWNPGGSKTVVYNGTWTAQNQNSYLALYGWTRNPLIEYYIVEAFGTYNPSSGTQRKGTITSDGGTYDIYETKRNNQPSIEGRKSFTQFWSVRQGRRVGGEITTGNHFAAWEKSGLKLGTHDYMLLGTEGYGSSGSSAINVVEKGATGKPYPDEPDSRKDNN